VTAATVVMPHTVRVERWSEPDHAFYAQAYVTGDGALHVNEPGSLWPHVFTVGPDDVAGLLANRLVMLSDEARCRWLVRLAVT
jgi:hypothetical protein